MKKQSEREQIAERFVEFVRSNDLVQVFGGDVELVKNQSRSGKHYVVLFSRRATLDGIIRIFSPGRIHIWSKGPEGFGSTTFRSPSTALEFLKTAFVQQNREAARLLI